ncbi:MAG: DUF2358 domain-containing protein [Cyanobacteria bacterium]|nr:DUF2358 domain-containing protein [Cyanobacteriota bacterium]
MALPPPSASPDAADPVAAAVLAQLEVDYGRFPQDQTYALYAEDVYFKDPTSEFRGRDRYRQTIAFIDRWFRNISLELHAIAVTAQAPTTLRSDWTLRWTAPLPWSPAIAISGWSELVLNPDGLIISHIDYWHCTRWQVALQHLGLSPRPQG